MFYQATTNLEDNLLDLATAAIMAPLQAAWGTAWLLWRIIAGLYSVAQWASAVLCGLWRPLVYIAAIGAGWAVCLAFPLVPVAVGLIVMFAYCTCPRTAVG